MSDERTPIEDMKETFDKLREQDGEPVKVYMLQDAYDRLSPEMIASQAESFLGSVGADCIKTGVLPTEEIIEAVAGVLRQYTRVPKLIDPVIVNFAGEQLVSDALETASAHEDGSDGVCEIVHWVDVSGQIRPVGH